MTRQEHIDWAKARAIEYIHSGDLQGAFQSIASDLQKHPETRGHAGIQLGSMLLMHGHLNNSSKMQEFIEGFD